MTDITNQALGGDESFASSQRKIEVIEHVVDVKRAVADGFTAGDSIKIVTLPAGTILFYVDAEIVEALVLGTTPLTDVGLTEADPDDYVDGQSDTAVGRFSAYVSATFPTVLTSDTPIYASFSGSAVTSGKVAVSIIAAPPVKQTFAPAVPKVYTNS